VVIDRRLFRAVVPDPKWAAGIGRKLAVASLVSWAGAITAGRLLAYTYRRLTVNF
jgi:hypothetical protein